MRMILSGWCCKKTVGFQNSAFCFSKILSADEPTVQWVLGPWRSEVLCTQLHLWSSDGNSEFMSSRPALISVCLLIERVRSSALQSVRTHNHVFCGDTKETIQLEQLSTPCYFELGAHKVRIVFVYLIHCLFTFHSLISCPYHSLISFEDCLSAVHLVLSL